MFQAKVVEEIKHPFLFNNLLKSCLLWDNVENCSRAGQAKRDNMGHAHCLLDI